MRNYSIILLTCLLTFPLIVFGQRSGMFIEQIGGKKIVRVNFDKTDQILNQQTFLIGELKKEGGTYKLDVVTELYNKNGQLNEKYTTTYQCNPNEFDMLLNVFPFTDPNDEKIKVEVTSEDFKQIYDLQSTEKLKDIHLKMSIESGLLNFFGSKSLITIKNRNRKIENGKINISSKAVIEAYMMGIKVKTLNYTIEEYLTEDYVLQRQDFRADDGAYFTMTYDGQY